MELNKEPNDEEVNIVVEAERALPSQVIRGSEYAAALIEMKALDKVLLIVQENRGAVHDIREFLRDYPDGVTEEKLYRHLMLDMLTPDHWETVKRYVTLSHVLPGPAIDVTYEGEEIIPTFKLGED